MGVPKFFRWISERYPKINQRVAFVPTVETYQEHFDGHAPPDPVEPPDLMATVSRPPPIDRLYIDMNGIIHGCSHNNNDNDNSDTTTKDPGVSEKDIFNNVCYYLDRLVKDMAQPTELVYMAIDGVAPRAKLNQQRSRRYRSGKDGEIEQTVYHAHMAKEQELFDDDEDDDDDDETSLGNEVSYSYSETTDSVLEEVEPGRFTGTFETSDTVSQVDLPLSESDPDDIPFSSNEITPGTPFFSECINHLEHFIKYKLSTDPKWQHLTIIFSGPNVPGEGEHKIMDFIRKEQNVGTRYHANLRHCIMGQDGDLVMLGLATHERNLVLLREEVVFDQRRQRRLASAVPSQSEEEEQEGSPPPTSGTSAALSRYIHNHNFEFLHMNVLRDYLAFEFETRNVVPHNKWDLERTIDDFVFMTFFVGNDFLPHMPALDIADEAFDLLFYTYKQLRKQWQKEKGGKPPYLTDSGTIVSGRRLQDFLTTLGAHETVYYDNKKMTASRDNKKWRKQDRRAKRESAIPSDSVLESKEQADRAEYLEMLESAVQEQVAAKESFAPVLTKDIVPEEKNKDFVPETQQEPDQGFFSKLLQFVTTPSKQGESNAAATAATIAEAANEEDLKGRYYFGKFKFTPFDSEKHRALRKAYIEGLVWNLKYYYEGCVSWEWYYPYHYGPMLSDLVGIDDFLKEISFDELGEPLRPFEQLMGCLPPSNAHLVPEPYRWLLTDESSPIAEFYPRSFTVDMNGKRWPWEAVVLLPFIDSRRLVDASRTYVSEDMLSEEERRRNVIGKPVVFSHDPQHLEENVTGVGSENRKYFATIEQCTAKIQPLESTEWDTKQPKDNPRFRPKPPSKDAVTLQAGFATLQDAPIQSLWRRRLGINVFGLRSRYLTAILDMADNKPPLPPVSVLGPEFIGTTVFIGYPYFTEGFVTAVSDAEVTVRGTNPSRPWTEDEKQNWNDTKKTLLKKATTGEGLCGTGGLKIPSSGTTFSVRPLQGIESLSDGSSVKIYAKFEVEVPIDSALLTPSAYDSRLSTIPARLEKDPYFSNLHENAEQSEIETHAMNGISAAVTQSAIRLTTSQETPHSQTSVASDVGFPVSSLQTSVPRIIIGQVSGGIGSSILVPPPNETRFWSAAGSSEPKIVVASTSSKSFSNSVPRAGGPTSLSELLKRRPRASRRRYASLSHSRHTCAGRSPSNVRGRLIVGGAVAMALFVNKTSGMFSTPCKAVRPSFYPDTVSIRGGNQVNDDDFRVEDDMLRSVPPPPLEFDHGTTTLSFIFQGGIIAAVDSRASIGNFVGSKTTQKVLPINDHMLGTMAGGAADCSFWIRRLKAEALLHELTEGRRMPVARASRILSNALYENRALDLSVGTMIMGFDEDSGPSIFYVDNSGVRIGGDLFSVGSGSTFALGILDTERRYDMTEQEAIALGIKAIRHATFRDAFSGGYIGVYLITKDGWKKVFSEDLALAAEHMLMETGDEQKTTGV